MSPCGPWEFHEITVVAAAHVGVTVPTFDNTPLLDRHAG
jgi:hypothetical protein